MTLDSRTRWYALHRSLFRHADDRSRLDDRERRAAVHQGRPRLLGDLAGLGRECLPADVRRLPAPRRTAWRPVRSAPVLHRRHRPLHARLARVRTLDLAGDTDRRARRPGPRRRSRIRRVALAHHEPVHRAGRACQGDGHLRLRGLRRWLHRRVAGRRPHRRARLALDLPGQHPDRRGGRGVLVPAPAGEPRAGVAREARRGGRGHRHGRADACRVCDSQRQSAGLAVRADASASLRFPRPCSRSSS